MTTFVVAIQFNIFDLSQNQKVFFFFFHQHVHVSLISKYCKLNAKVYFVQKQILGLSRLFSVLYIIENSLVNSVKTFLWKHLYLYVFSVFYLAKSVIE